MGWWFSLGPSPPIVRAPEYGVNKGRNILAIVPCGTYYCVGGGCDPKLSGLGKQVKASVRKEFQ